MSLRFDEIKHENVEILLIDASIDTRSESGAKVL